MISQGYCANIENESTNKPLILQKINAAENVIKDYGNHQLYPEPNIIADLFIPDSIENKSKEFYKISRDNNKEALLLLDQAKIAVRNSNYDIADQLYKKAFTMHKISHSNYTNSINLLRDGIDIGKDLAIAKFASIPASLYGKAVGLDKGLYVAEKYTEYEIAKAFDGSTEAAKTTAKSILLDAIIAKAGIGEKFKDAWGQSSVYSQLNNMVDKLGNLPLTQRENIIKNIMAIVGKTGNVTIEELLSNISNEVLKGLFPKESETIDRLSIQRTNYIREMTEVTDNIKYIERRSKDETEKLQLMLDQDFKSSGDNARTRNNALSLQETKERYELEITQQKRRLTGLTERVDKIENWFNILLTSLKNGGAINYENQKVNLLINNNPQNQIIIKMVNVKRDIEQIEENINYLENKYRNEIELSELGLKQELRRSGETFSTKSHAQLINEHKAIKELELNQQKRRLNELIEQLNSIK